MGRPKGSKDRLPRYSITFDEDDLDVVAEHYRNAIEAGKEWALRDVFNKKCYALKPYAMRDEKEDALMDLQIEQAKLDIAERKEYFDKIDRIAEKLGI